MPMAAHMNRDALGEYDLHEKVHLTDLWNMSQSGWTRAERKTELKAQAPTWGALLAGSRGQKSSEARATAVSVNLHADAVHGH